MAEEGLNKHWLENPRERSKLKIECVDCRVKMEYSGAKLEADGTHYFWFCPNCLGTKEVR